MVGEDVMPNEGSMAVRVRSEIAQELDDLLDVASRYLVDEIEIKTTARKYKLKMTNPFDSMQPNLEAAERDKISDEEILMNPMAGLE